MNNLSIEEQLRIASQGATLDENQNFKSIINGETPTRELSKETSQYTSYNNRNTVPQEQFGNTSHQQLSVSPNDIKKLSLFQIYLNLIALRHRMLLRGLLM
ncbi:hypothetical protein [Eggerthia catenaformis]